MKKIIKLKKQREKYNFIFHLLMIIFFILISINPIIISKPIENYLYNSKTNYHFSNSFYIDEYNDNRETTNQKEVFMNTLIKKADKCYTHNSIFHSRKRIIELENSYNKPELNKNTLYHPAINKEIGTKIIVDTNGTADFTSIQEAVDAASDGDTVHVNPGIYQEYIIINKSIIIEGEDPNSTIIDGNNFIDVIVILADDVIVQNMTIIHGLDGIDIRYGSNITVQNNIIKDNEDGVDIHLESSNITIKNNIIRDNEYYGIGINDVNTINIFSNTINKNQWDGVNIAYSSNIQVFNNRFENNADYGILLDHSKDNTIENNTFSSDGIVIQGSQLAHWNSHVFINNTVNKKPLYFFKDITNFTFSDDAGQIILVNCSDFEINNTIIKNTSIAVQVAFCSDCRINNNVIVNCNDKGIFSIFSDQNEYINNIIMNNEYVGLYFHYSYDNVCIQNDIVENQFNGIRLTYSEDNKLFNNNISNNRYGGIYLDRSQKNQIHNNEIKENGFYGGICLNDFSNDNSIVNNSFSLNGLTIIYSYQNHVHDNSVNNKPLVYLENGDSYSIDRAGQIILINCSNITVKQCFFDNVTIGLQMWNTDNCSIIENYFSSNDNMATLLIHSSDNEIIGNIIKDNADGMNFYQSDQNIFSLNTISNNSNIGVGVINSKLIYISNNYFEGNGQTGILVTSSTNNYIFDNFVMHSQIGIFLNDRSDKNNIKKNMCYNNYIDGIAIFGDSVSNTICYNICESNLKGISVRDSRACQIYENTVMTNQQAILLNNVEQTFISNNNCSHNYVGIYVHESKENKIQNNTIKFNNHKGIVLQSRSDNNVLNGNIIGPRNYQGIYIEQSFFNQIKFNNIYRNNDDGIGLYFTYGNNIHDNNIHENTNYGIEGLFCFDNARKNYWGEYKNPWLNHGILVLGFVPVHPCLRNPISKY